MLGSAAGSGTVQEKVLGTPALGTSVPAVIVPAVIVPADPLIDR